MKKAQHLSREERDYMVRRVRLLADRGALLTKPQMAKEFNVTTAQIDAIDREAFPVTSQRPKRQRRRALTADEKKNLALAVAELAGRGLSDPKIAREIGLSDQQVAKVRAHAGIQPGRRPKNTYSAAVKGTIVACPDCNTTVTVERHGRLEPHRYLGPTRNGVVLAVWCTGSKEKTNA